MSGVIRSADEAFRAGWDAPCEHGHCPVECPHCRLTEAEIGQLLVLHRPYVRRNGAAEHRAA